MFHGFDPKEQCLLSLLVGWERDSPHTLVTIIGWWNPQTRQPRGVSCKKNPTFVNGHQPPRLFLRFFQHQGCRVRHIRHMPSCAQSNLGVILSLFIFVMEHGQDTSDLWWFTYEKWWCSKELRETTSVYLKSLHLKTPSDLDYLSSLCRSGKQLL